MKKNIFKVNEEEKRRILEMHINATNKIYLPSKKDDDNLIKETLSFLVKNNKTLLKEGDEKWKTTYSCVPKFPGAEKITLNDGSTGYKIESGTYYNNGRVDIGVRQNYSCNDMMFKYPKNQKDGDAFRNWLFKNYDSKDLKSNFDLDRSGPYNSPALASAWIVYGDKYSNKKGRENPSTYIPNVTYDAKCNNVPNMEYNETYKRCFLSKERQKSLGSSVNFNDEDFFPVKDDNEWYAYYALYMAQGVETQVADKWTYNTSTGACKGSSDGSKGLNFPNKGTRNDLNAANLWEAISFNETPNQYGRPRNIEQMYTICFNESIVFGKPLGDIDVNNLTATAGRMDKSSFNRYNGYIPSYAEVIKAYGLHDVSAYTNKIWKTDFGIFVSSKSNTGDVKNKKPSTGGDLVKEFINNNFSNIDVADIDVLINLISLCLDMIPGIGQMASFVVDQIHAISYLIRAAFADNTRDSIIDMIMFIVQATAGSIPAVGNIQMITLSKLVEEWLKYEAKLASKDFVVFLYKVLKHFNGDSTPQSIGTIIVGIYDNIKSIYDFVQEHDAYFPDIMSEVLKSLMDIFTTSKVYNDKDWDEAKRQVDEV